MAEQQTTPAENKEPSNLDVIVAVLEQLPSELPPMDRMEIRRATARRFAYRIFPRGGGDYHGGILVLDEPAE